MVGGHGPTKGKRVVIQTDGASRGNPGPASVGIVIFDTSTGEVHALGRRLGTATNNVAEYSAVVTGLKMARQLGAASVLLQADSELLVRQLEGRYKVKAENLMPLYDEALALLKSFAAYAVVHIPRERNTLADRMANEALDGGPAR